MRKTLFLCAITLLLPAAALAEGLAAPSDGITYASVFAERFSLLLSIVIGIIATFIVFRAAKRLGGGLFGAVLNYVGIGMFFIVLGSVISSLISLWSLGFWLNVSSTVFFALGYIFMVLGANKLFKGIMST